MAAAPSVAVFVIWRTVMAMGLGGVQIGSTTLGTSGIQQFNSMEQFNRASYGGQMKFYCRFIANLSNHGSPSLSSI